jgi:hypothetical protein
MSLITCDRNLRPHGIGPACPNPKPYPKPMFDEYIKDAINDLVHLTNEQREKFFDRLNATFCRECGRVKEEMCSCEGNAL